MEKTSQPLSQTQHHYANYTTTLSATYRHLLQASSSSITFFPMSTLQNLSTLLQINTPT